MEQYTTSILDYKVTWALNEGDTIAASEWQSAPEGGFTASQHTDTEAVTAFAADTPSSYKIANTITTTMGRKHTRVFFVHVKDAL